MVSQTQMIGMHLLTSLLGVAAASPTLEGTQNPTSLRGERGLAQFQGSSHNEDHAAMIHRALQETVVVIPIMIIPIIFIIVLCCCRRNKNKQAQQQEVNAAARERQLQTTKAAVDSKPRLVTAAAIKFSPEARAGIAFAGTDYAEVTRILPESIFHGSALSPGMKVVSINNISITSSKHASQVIGASKSIITILAHTAGYFGETESLVTATVRKDQPDQPSGIIYRKEEYSKINRVKALSKASLFLESDLAAGMEVVAINNVEPQTPMQAKELTQSAFPLLTILARRNSAVAVEVQPANSEMEMTSTATVLGVDNNDDAGQIEVRI